MRYSNRVVSNSNKAHRVVVKEVVYEANKDREIIALTLHTLQSTEFS